MTSSHHGPYDQGYTRATMAYTKRSDLARASGPHKVCRSPDWSLQLDSMKSESLVIVDQNATVNTFPGLVHTARHTMGVGCKRSARASGPHKVCRSPDWSLQLDSMKSESLVIVDQNATVNTFPGLVHTARHTMGVGCKRSR